MFNTLEPCSEHIEYEIYERSIHNWSSFCNYFIEPDPKTTQTYDHKREWEKQKKISGLKRLNDRADSDEASAEWDTVSGVANWGTCNMTQMNKKYLANDLLFKKAP